MVDCLLIAFYYKSQEHLTPWGEGGMIEKAKSRNGLFLPLSVLVSLTQTRTHIIHKCLKQYFFIITKAGNNLGVLLLMNEQMMIYPFKGRLTSNKEQ